MTEKRGRTYLRSLCTDIPWRSKCEEECAKRILTAHAHLSFLKRPPSLCILFFIKTAEKLVVEPPMAVDLSLLPLLTDFSLSHRDNLTSRHGVIKEIVNVVPLSPHEPVKNRTMEQIVDVLVLPLQKDLVPQMLKVSVELVSLTPWDCEVERGGLCCWMQCKATFAGALFETPCCVVISGQHAFFCSCRFHRECRRDRTS